MKLRQVFRSFIPLLLVASVFSILVLQSSSPVVAQGYRIALITNEQSLIPGSVTEQVTTLTGLNLQILRSWDEARGINPSTNLDGVIVDVSALQNVDTVWLSNAYQSGVVVAGLNTPGRDLANAVGSPCVVQTDSSGAAYYLVISRVLLAANPSDIPLVEGNERLCDGSAAQGVTGLAVILEGSSTSGLTTLDSYLEFANAVNGQIDSVKQTVNEFYSGALTTVPTDVAITNQ